MRFHGFALLVAAALATPLHAQVASDTLPASVVQRFVDAANALDVNAMMAVVAPEAAFAVLPGGQALATGRDSVRALYDRMFARPAARFRLDLSRDRWAHPARVGSQGTES